MIVNKPVMLAAGGTGGHLFPAEALATELHKRGVKTILVTDDRASHFTSDTFSGDTIYQIRSATPSTGSIFHKIKAAFILFKATRTARKLLLKIRPSVVIGFGGYPTVPPLLAATTFGIPSLLHEQNGVIGRANRFLASRVDVIATGFPSVKGLSEALKTKQNYVGNPVRAMVEIASHTPYPEFNTQTPLKLLVFGGSQGARVMSDVVPAMIALLPEHIRARIELTQQARSEDLKRLTQMYAQQGFNVVLESFFSDLPVRIANSHLIIGRSGASTVAELAAIGRPSILVPLPGAIDQDQAANAQLLSDVGAATVIAQPELTPEKLAEVILSYFDTPSRLTAAAMAAKSVGRLDAAARLADIVMALAHNNTNTIQETQS